MNTIALIGRPLMRLWMFGVVVALLGAFMLVPAARATSEFSPAATSQQTQANCPPGETEDLIWPTLQAVAPTNSYPGDAVEVSGFGGYIHCSGGLYNESARSFDLTFDGQQIGQLGCYSNHCQTSITIPAEAALGTHILSTEGGSQFTIQIQQVRMLPRIVFLPAVVHGSAEPAVTGCSANETATLIPPTLQTLNPSSVVAGGSVNVVGSGGYIRCSGGLYNESARSFPLALNGSDIAELSCYANRCEGTLIVPISTDSGTYSVSTFGGSQLPLEVQ